MQVERLCLGVVWDRTMLAEVFVPASCGMEFSLMRVPGGGGAAAADVLAPEPGATTHAALVAWVDGLPHAPPPTWLGLAATADNRLMMLRVCMSRGAALCGCIPCKPTTTHHPPRPWYLLPCPVFLSPSQPLTHTSVSLALCISFYGISASRHLTCTGLLLWRFLMCCRLCCGAGSSLFVWSPVVA